MKINLVGIIGAVLVCQLAGVIGAVFTTPSIPTWYAGLNKPSFQPPNWLFGPAWTLLYTLMGIALYLIWTKGLSAAGVKTALVVFGIQLLLNTLWSILFFGMKNPALALIEIVILWAAILLTLVRFYAISRTAGLLLVPYLLWVSFATVLNFSIVRLN